MGVSTAPPSPSPLCVSNVDCNMAGVCDVEVGKCACDAGWTGDQCEKINFGKAYRCDEGGLCLQGEMNFTSSWGGNIVQADDGSFHMYAASFADNAKLDLWLEKSRVVHANSSNAAGPYVLQDIALGDLDDPTAWDGLTQHNPVVQRAPDGTYLLYYMGAQREATTDLPGVHEANFTCPLRPDNLQETVCMQRVGLATSRSPNGPWERRSAPLLDAGPEGEWDDLFTTNPTPHVFPNGSVLLIYKARSRADYRVMSTGAAFADHWAGPYRRLTATPIDLPGNCEDAGIYRSEAMDVFRMVLHCGCNYQTVWSQDGLVWTKTAAQQPWCEVTYEDGTTEQMKRRERPKWWLDSKGRPQYLLTGVTPTASHGGKVFTFVQEVL